MHRLRLILLKLFMLVGVALCALPALQAQESPRDAWSFRFDLFQLMLERQGLEAVSEPDRLDEMSPAQTVVVLMGDRHGVRQDVAGLLRRGAMILAASDVGGRFLDIGFARGPVTVPPVSAALKGFEDCPVLRGFRSHPVMRSVTSLAANRPGYLFPLRRPLRFTELAWLPPESRIRGWPVGPRPIIGEYAPFAGGGRAIVAADHSLFTNQMLLQADNALLAWNTTQWLVADGKRKFLVFYDSGRLLGPASLDLSILSPTGIPDVVEDNVPDLPPESFVTFANAFVAGLEDNDVFNRVVENQPRGVRPLIFRRAVLLVLTCTLAALGVLLLLFQRSVRAGAPPPAVDARSQWTRRPGALGSVAVVLARGFFTQIGALSVEPTSGCTIAEPPRVKVHGNVHLQRRVARQVRKLWKLATGAQRRRMRRKGLERLAASIRELQALHARGRLHLSS